MLLGVDVAKIAVELAVHLRTGSTDVTQMCGARELVPRGFQRLLAQ